MAPHNSKRNVRMHGTDRRFHTRTATQSRSSTLETTSKQDSLRSNGQVLSLPHGNPSPSHSAQRPTTGEVFAGHNRTLASKPVDMCIAAGPCTRSQRCVRWAASLPCRRLRPAICRSRQLAVAAHADVRRYPYSSSRTTSVGRGKSAPGCVHDSQDRGTRLRTDAARVTISHAHW